MATEEEEMMCEKCEALQARCVDIADWLEKRNLTKPSEEDIDLISFLVSKGMTVVPGFPFPVLVSEALVGITGSVYLAGYKKGYEVHQLETMEKK